jgi:cell division protein ZapA
MSNKVTLNIAGRVFTIACDEGQESRVQHLAAYIDQKMRDVVRNGGTNNNESYQWLLVSLMLADELATARDQLGNTQMDTRQVDAKIQRQNEIDVEAVRHLSHRIEELAEKLSVIS